MDRVGLLGRVFPEMAAMKGIEQDGYHALDVWSHTMLCLKELEILLANPREEFGDAAADFRDYLADAFVRGRSRAALLKLAALLHDAGKPGKASRDVEGQTHFYGHAAAGEAFAEAVAERLRLAKAERDYLKLLVVNHMHLVHLTAETSRSRRSVLHFFRKYGEDYRALLLLFAADTRATAGPKMTPERVRLIRDAVTEMLRLYEEDLRPRLQAPPLLTGGDLIDRFGLEPGPLIGEILRKVEDARLEGLVIDRDSALEVAGALLKRQRVRGLAHPLTFKPSQLLFRRRRKEVARMSFGKQGSRVRTTTTGPKPAGERSVEDVVRGLKEGMQKPPGEDYRERSLAIHGLICARCAREFDTSNRHLLTVHHKDGNHHNNPPDGSNWENLCVYCHEDAHSRGLLGDYYDGTGDEGKTPRPYKRHGRGRQSGPGEPGRQTQGSP